MKLKKHILLLLILISAGCKNKSANLHDARNDSKSNLFPSEIVDFIPHPNNPIFSGTGEDSWDQKIRERGYILKENDMFYLWYTGFQKGGEDTLKLGFATSEDGISWARYEGNPVFAESWTEDMMVLKSNNTYYMFAEGRNDIAHMLTSIDRVTWTDHGPLDIRNSNGDPLSEGPYGTPTVWLEHGIWYLFYERNDLGIWLATSKDLEVWNNFQDDPVISMGPDPYDKFGLAVNQILKYNDAYYAYYHGTAYEDWHEWTTNVATSKDLVHWKKYPQNPIMRENKSSGILVYDGEQYRLYTMHDNVAVHYHTIPEKN